jgi:hypothetical protein
MSWVEDARNLMQDFVAPELRATSAKIEAIKDQITAGENLAGERHTALLDKLEGTRREILLQLSLALANQKIEELQARQRQNIGRQAAVGS